MSDRVPEELKRVAEEEERARTTVFPLSEREGYCGEIERESLGR